MKLTQRKFERAFTFIELLVIVGITGLLVCVLGAGRGINRTNSSSFQCLNNHRQLLAAWKMYADDNAGVLVYNTDGTSVGKTAGNECWVAGWMDFSASTDNTNTLYLVRHDLTPYGAFLGTYAKSPSIFRCPADKATAPVLGKPTLRVRSVSMNNYFGTHSRSWMTPSRYVLHSRLNQIKSPSTQFVFLDEREDSINDGMFFSDPDTAYQVIDYPASHHDCAGAFSFVDGRAEIHRWTDPRTMPVLQPGQLLQLNVNLPGDVDVDWLQQHASELQ